MIYIIFALNAVIFGALSAIAVKNKNRDQFGWFFIGFFFGIFGLIASLIVDKIESENRLNKELLSFDLDQQTKKCPDCAEVIKLEAKICRFCRHQFSDDEISALIIEAKIEFINRQSFNSQQGQVVGNENDVNKLTKEYSSYSTKKLKKMKSQGQDSWRLEALAAVDNVLRERAEL